MMCLKSFGNTATVVTLNTPTVDAEWFIDFTKFGAFVNVELSALAQIIPVTTSAKLELWASSSQGNNFGAGTKLCELDVPVGGTGGAFVGYAVAAQFANPGGQKFVALVSTAGGA